MACDRNYLSRREFVRLAGVAAAGSVVCARQLQAEPPGTVSLFDGKTLDGWNQIEAHPSGPGEGAAAGWMVKDGVMASTGSGRGVIYTAKDYSRFRLMFTMRHVAGNPDHQACVLLFCVRPQGDEKPLDALGGIQFQVPNGGHWEYRPGLNTAGGAEFTTVTKPQFDVHAWSRVEILADADAGTARMAVAQPPGSKAIEVLDFKDATAGRTGPIAWQMHNAGLFDEYKDVTIEPDPKIDDLLTLR